MSTSRNRVRTANGRMTAMKTAVDKHNSIIAPNKSAISSETATRLEADSTTYEDALSLVETTEEAQGAASKTVIINRKLLRTNVSCYFRVLNIGIELGLIPASARALYGLDIGNEKLPDIDTDTKLMHWANEVVTGDAKRIALGGVVITMPSQASFTLVYTNGKTAITDYGTAKEALTNAHTAVNNLNAEADNIILRTWNEVETTFSELPAATMRVHSRQYGVKYVSVGKPALITGKFTDSLTGAPIPDATVHLDGIANKEISDSEGNYKLGTLQYGDLVLIAIAKDYKQSETSITMENGVDMVVNIVLVHI